MRDIDHGTKKHDIGDCKEWDKSVLDWNILSRQMFRVIKNNSHAYIWCSEKQAMRNDGIVHNMEKAGFKFYQLLVWVKNRSSIDMTFGYKYMYSHEICLFFQKGAKKLNKKKINDRTVFKYDLMGEQNDYIHPTQKPLPIFRDLIFNSTEENDVVCDLFMGSGTTALAAKQLKRRFIGFELSNYYCKMAVKRVNGFQILEKFI
jgi:DNA modification methylase